MNKNILVDSSVLISFFRVNEPDHEKAKEILSQRDNFFVLNHILGEVYTVLMLRESYSVAKGAFSWILKEEGFVVLRPTDEEMTHLADFITDNKSKLSFVDILLLVISRVRNYELVTFEKAREGQFEI